MGAVSAAVLFALTVCCVLANAFEVGAKLLRARFVVQNATEIGLDPRRLPILALLEGAGAFGVLAGLFGLRQLGLAAAVGLVLFFVGAVLAHLRARVLHNLAFPLVFLALAIAPVLRFG
ncbi:DoxX family protein [Kitasatospora sp. NPDC059646]|uniref:DoxX family protein n=1 Tax=Kitasatospora sp. NPDC059646 TaxID=3346893 RepID=UPI0036D14F83